MVIEGWFMKQTVTNADQPNEDVGYVKIAITTFP
jgi:hypothetical protein